MAKADRLEAVTDLRLYTLTELESIIGVTHRSLLTYIKDGRLKGKKIAGKWRVTESELKRFVYGEGEAQPA